MCQCLSSPTSTPHVLSLLCVVPFEITDAFLFPPEQSHWELAFLFLAVWELRPPCKRISYNHRPCFSAGRSYKSLQGAHGHQAGRRLEALRPFPQTDVCPRAPCPSPCAIHFGSWLSFKTMLQPGRLGVKMSLMRQAAMRSSPCATGHVPVEVSEGLPHPGEVGKCDVVARLCPLEVGRRAWLHHPSHTPWEQQAASDLNHRHPVPYTIVLMSLISAISKHSSAAIMPFLSNLP